MSKKFYSFLFPVVFALVTVFSVAILSSCNAEDQTNPDGVKPQFVDGLAQPIYPYTAPDAENYSDETSEIMRYCVWVETSLDTDDDGQKDLIKAFVQVPRAAYNNDYKAATIYEARPYSSGHCAYHPENFMASNQIDATSWSYKNPYKDEDCYLNTKAYDYFLVRGFAVVMSSGLGTTGSDGFESCGTQDELDAFASVIEWLHGDRIAYSNPDRQDKVKASWSNKRVGMMGVSYGGTIPFGLATKGVKGLETIIPIAGIASWYEYTNAQGMDRNKDSYKYLLAGYCTSRSLDKEDWTNIKDANYEFRQDMRNAEKEANGNYADYWKEGDYTLNYKNIKAPALIIHGLNDDNVTTKQSQLMYEAYKKAGVPAKMIFHQGAHFNPSVLARNYEIMIGDSTYDEVINRWFSHYLYRVDNGVENMPLLTTQSNVDGTYSYSDSYGEYQSQEYKIGSAKITSENFVNLDAEWTDENWHHGTDAHVFTSEWTIDKDVELQGSAKVNLNITLDSLPENKDNLMMTAYLVDESDTQFNAYSKPIGESSVPVKYVEKPVAVQVPGVRDYKIVDFQETPTLYKRFTYGWMDLANPDAKFDSRSATAKEDGINVGDTFDYEITLMPDDYILKAGHKLKLYIFTWDMEALNVNDDEEPVYDAAQWKDYINRSYSFTINEGKLTFPIA